VIDPTVAFPPGIPSTEKLTPFETVPETEAVNWLVAPCRTLTEDGVRETEIGFRLTLAVATKDPSATLFAVMTAPVPPVAGAV
jgi:hypothetical protein